MAFFWEVVVGKIDFFFNNFCRFLQIFADFYFFGAFSFCAVGRFWTFFDIFRICSDFLAPPAIYFTDFEAILAIFNHFWAIFGPFLGRKLFAFFAEKWHFGPESQNPEIL